MIKRFKLRNKQQQQIATVLYFYEEQISKNVGIIIDYKLTIMKSSNYDSEDKKYVISDLAKKCNIDFFDFIEIV